MLCHRRFTDSQVDNFAECLEESCPLWDERLEMCSDVAKVDFLERICKALETISRTLYDLKK